MSCCGFRSRGAWTCPEVRRLAWEGLLRRGGAGGKALEECEFHGGPLVVGDGVHHGVSDRAVLEHGVLPKHAVLLRAKPLDRST